jgi:Short C-terminal domain
VIDDLPPGTPSVPNLPCEPPSSGRGFQIRPGFSVMTGYVTDAVAQLARLRDQGVITDAEYDTALSYQHAG